MSSVAETLKIIEQALQGGNIDAAVSSLHKVNTQQLGAGEIAHYAQLAWRSGAPDLGLKLLSALLKNPARASHPAEWAEYSCCLSSLGALQQARDILKRKCAGYQLQRLYLGFSFIYEWDYAQALVYLEASLAGDDLTAYQKQVLQVNLLSCYISEERFVEAESLLASLWSEIAPAHQRLRMNVGELKLQLLVAQSKFQQALLCLNDDQNVPGSGPESFYYQKWKSILEVEMGTSDPDELLRLRDRAWGLGLWEVARDCEARVAFKTGNVVFLKRIYYATPWRSYRLRIEKRAPMAETFKEPFNFWLWPQEETKNFTQTRRSPEPSHIVDVVNGVLGVQQLKRGAIAHRLLQALAEDLFIPHPVGRLFYKLYEDETFDFYSSPLRIYRAINELREAFKAAQIPIDIETRNLGYRLIASEPVILRLAAGRIKATNQMRLDSLREISVQEFTAHWVAETLGVSSKTAQRLIKMALDQGQIVKTGAGAKTHYHWVDKKKSV